MAFPLVFLTLGMYYRLKHQISWLSIQSVHINMKQALREFC